MNVFSNLNLIIQKCKTRTAKIIFLILLGVIVVGWFAYRFAVVSYERNLPVVNVTRINLENGTPVVVNEIKYKKDFLYEPLNVKYNRAYVSGARIKSFKAGQSLGSCNIVSVSNNIDLNTGMHVIQTNNCKDGLLYVKIPYEGLFVPSSAVFGNVVYVVNGDKAEVRKVDVVARDLQNVLVKSGIQDGDVVIMSTVQDGQKIKVMKE